MSILSSRLTNSFYDNQLTEQIVRQMVSDMPTHDNCGTTMSYQLQSGTATTSVTLRQALCPFSIEIIVTDWFKFELVRLIYILRNPALFIHSIRFVFIFSKLQTRSLPKKLRRLLKNYQSSLNERHVLRLDIWCITWNNSTWLV